MGGCPGIQATCGEGGRFWTCCACSGSGEGGKIPGAGGRLPGRRGLAELARDLEAEAERAEACRAIKARLLVWPKRRPALVTSIAGAPQPQRRVGGVLGATPPVGLPSPGKSQALPMTAIPQPRLHPALKTRHRPVHRPAGPALNCRAIGTGPPSPGSGQGRSASPHRHPRRQASRPRLGH